MRSMEIGKAHKTDGDVLHLDEGTVDAQRHLGQGTGLFHLVISPPLYPVGENDQDNANGQSEP